VPRFCLLSVLVTVAAAGFSWLVAVAVFGLTGIPAAAATVTIFLLLVLVLAVTARTMRNRKRRNYLRAMSELDANGYPVHLDEQTETIKRMTGVAVGLLVPPQELAATPEDQLIGAVALSMQISKLTSDYQTCFAELDPSAAQQVEATMSVARQVQELYNGELVKRGWSEQRIARNAQSMNRMSELASRRNKQS
jgi:hypothetical protein